MVVEALLLDLGDTLIAGGKVIDHVPEALSALARQTTASGAPLRSALVSDYTTAAKPEDVARLFGEYTDIVRGLGLLALFRLALDRLGIVAGLSAAMFITEDAGHVAAARGLGMTAWQFGTDFTDWAEVPALVARAIDSQSTTSLGNGV